MYALLKRPQLPGSIPPGRGLRPPLAPRRPQPRPLPVRLAWIALFPVLLGIVPWHALVAQSPLYDNLGTHHYAVTTEVADAQAYFDQGLRLYYAFNHAEAIRSFDEAARLDPRCAMCVWGRALALGPNINLPMDSASAAAAAAASQGAMDRRQWASPREREMIESLHVRYGDGDRAALDSLYARTMGDLADRYPTDPEISTLHAEALMDLSPWNYWDDGDPRPDTPEILARLEAVLAASPDHPGANHFYIHAVEAVDPARAVPMAERLAGLMPGAGHLVHMPGHIYIRVGRYEDAIRANEHAVHADESWIRDHNPEMGVYTLGYYPHNYDFLAFAASMLGRREQTLEAAEAIAGLVPAELLGLPGMTFLQHHRTRHLQMKVRFGMWDAILATPAPPEGLPHARAIWHYAQGRALAAVGDPDEAERELERIRAFAGDPEVAPLPLEFNTVGDVLGVASAVLAGHVARARGDLEAAVDHLREAVALEDAMTYGEPPEWSVPVRQELGMVLLESDRRAEAERAFSEDLEQFPENVWSLEGLIRSRAGRPADCEFEAADPVWGFNPGWRLRHAHRDSGATPDRRR